MAKKPKNSAATLAMPDYSKIYKQMQDSVNKTSIQIQQMSDATSAKTFKFNQDEAEKSRTWQKQMSNTSHQREVADLKASGLNPVLSANNGAQSYTTSSASGSAENPANAVAQLEGSKLNFAANAYGANLSARATQKAAEISSAATLSAAQQQAAAQRYASNMNYKLGVYKANLDYNAKKYAADRAYQAAIDKPVSNVFGAVDKLMNGTGLTAAIRKSVASIGNEFINKSDKYFVGQNNSVNKFTLDKQGIILAKDGLKKLGVKDTGANRTLFVKAVVFGDSKAQKTLNDLIPYGEITNKDIGWYDKNGFWHHY